MDSTVYSIIKIAKIYLCFFVKFTSVFYVKNAGEAQAFLIKLVCNIRQLCIQMGF